MSNSDEVLGAFPSSELAVDLDKIDVDEPSEQRTLGVSWNIKNYCFTMSVITNDRPFTKRGNLLVINRNYEFMTQLVL